MKVALYYPWVYLTSGAERVLLELTGPGSGHQWTIFTNHFDPAHTYPEFAQREVVELKRVGVERSVKAVLKATWTIISQQLPLRGYDALVIVCEGVGDLVVFRVGNLPVVCVCLTPLRVAFDDVYLQRNLESRGWLRNLAVKAGRAAFRWVDRRAWRRYDGIFCISNEVKRRIVAGGLAVAEEVEVIYPGVGVRDAPAEVRYDRFFLLPGRIMWTKNIELGIQAFQRFAGMAPEFEEFRLVIAGIVDAKSQPYLTTLQELSAGDPRIEFRLLPSDAELSELYAACLSVLFTAFNEDWGIVPLEAMTFRKPVICTNRGGPRETVVDGTHGFLAEPSPEVFADRMARLARDSELAQRMGARGPDRAAEFSWDAFVAPVGDCIEKLGTAQSLHVDDAESDSSSYLGPGARKQAD